MRDVIRRARLLGKTTVVGGPAVTTSPESFDDATYLFQGEAEGRLDRLVEALEHPGSAAERVLSPPGEARPSLALARVPRFDLLRLDRYASLAVQVSRGCPFNCEFCDIIVMYGRKPRTKTVTQVMAEVRRDPPARVAQHLRRGRQLHRQPEGRRAAAPREKSPNGSARTGPRSTCTPRPAWTWPVTRSRRGHGRCRLQLGLRRPRDARPRDPEDDAEAPEPAHGPRRGGANALARRAGGVRRLHRRLRRRRRRSAAAAARVHHRPTPSPGPWWASSRPCRARSSGVGWSERGGSRTACTGDQFDRTNFETTMPEEELVAGYCAT